VKRAVSLSQQYLILDVSTLLLSTIFAISHHN